VCACTCPNCRQHIHFFRKAHRLSEQWKDQHPESIEIPDPGWSSGDRVLVAKFVYDLFERLPERMDVVVFKYPGDKDFPLRGPTRNHVPMNYIKRLIGRPGETIAIRLGKLYYLSANGGLKYDDYEQAKGDPSKLALLWQEKYMHRDDQEALKLFDAGRFQIVRKKPDTILAMRRLVYDHDRRPKDLKGEQWQRWVPGEPWSADEAGKGERGFQIAPADADKEHWLRYRHVLRGNPDKPQLITDFMGYNTWEAKGWDRDNGLSHSPPGENWASDLILECEVVVEDTRGEVTLEVSKGRDRFQARFDLGSGRCTLFRVTGKKKEQLGDSADARVNRKGTYRLRLANVDDKLTVWVDNRLPFEGDGVVYTARKDPLVPTEANDLLKPASVGSKGAKVKVRKLRLFRDTYYTTARGGQPSAADVPNVDFTDSKTWEKFQDAPRATFYVQPDHFLCLGDNSPESSDGRSWGLVPRRLLLGRALLVYYPFGRAGRIR
jgi:signal peptidase I